MTQVQAPAVPGTVAIASATNRARRARRGPKFWGPPLVVAAVIIAVWYAISLLLGKKDFLMPPPHEVIIKGFLTPKTLGDILEGLMRSGIVALTGLAVAIIIGVLWAVAMSQARWIERSLFPYAVILQCIPILALVPLIGFWFGFDFFSRMIVCVMIALFPMVSNTLFGLQSVEKPQRELFKLQGASRWTILTKLEFPTALPAIFAGMRISAGLAVVGAIVGDFFFRRGTPGIGALISNYQSRVQGAELFAAIIAASLFGVVIFAFFGWLGKRVVGKWYDFGSN
jgi:NitT/TauT family transport system permease protein